MKAEDLKIGLKVKTDNNGSILEGKIVSIDPSCKTFRMSTSKATGLFEGLTMFRSVLVTQYEYGDFVIVREKVRLFD